MALETAMWTTEDRRRAFNRNYFSGANGGHGGYANYVDFSRNFRAYDVILALKPESVLELGSARGYLLRRLEAAGIPCKGLEISRHCYLTRATDKLVSWDLLEFPWPIADKEFDVCFSFDVLDLIPESHLDLVFREMERVSRRGLHSLTFRATGTTLDVARVTFRPQSWWEGKVRAAGAAAQEIMDADKLFIGVSAIWFNTGVIKANFGSFFHMFHHGWINIDFLPLEDYASRMSYRFMRYDIRQPIPAPDNGTSLILISHLLDQLDEREAIAFLEECWRMLTPGGVIRIAVPDSEKLMRMYAENTLSYFDELNDDLAGMTDQASKLFNLLSCGRQCCYDQASLSSLMHKVGFSRIQKMPFGKSRSIQMQSETVDTLPDLSLYLEADKMTL